MSSDSFGDHLRSAIAPPPTQAEIQSSETKTRIILPQVVELMRIDAAESAGFMRERSVRPRQIGHLLGWYLTVEGRRVARNPKVLPRAMYEWDEFDLFTGYATTEAGQMIGYSASERVGKGSDEVFGDPAGIRPRESCPPNKMPPEGGEATGIDALVRAIAIDPSLPPNEQPYYVRWRSTVTNCLRRQISAR